MKKVYTEAKANVQTPGQRLRSQGFTTKVHKSMAEITFFKIWLKQAKTEKSCQGFSTWSSNSNVLMPS